MRSLYAKVIIDIAHSNVDRLFTYSVPEDMPLEPGHRVMAPFGAGNRPVEGFVLETTDTYDADGIRIKSISRMLESYTALTREQIRLAYWIRDSYHCLLVDALRLMIPAQLRGGRVSEKKINTVRIADGLNSKEILDALKKKDGSSRAPIQSEIVELLAGVNAPMSTADIAAFVPGASGAISALIKKGILTHEDHVTFRDPFGRASKRSEPMGLTADQANALECIRSMLAERAGTCLLYGVTGSGKTEVYMQAISGVLERGGRAIVLVPEISLTPQAMERFRNRFGERVAVLHSRLSPGERYDEWRRIRLGKADVVIGARSAIFAPVENLMLIVVDEEHEPSYRSEMNPRYGAVEVAAKRAAENGAVLVLGSATPSINSYRRAKSGTYRLITLPKRINASPMPHVDIVDMRNEFLTGNNSIFSAKLYDGLKQCIDAGEQAILFMNRRGYSTFVSCRGCGYVMKCPDCDVSMTYHKLENTMKCHYCGKTRRIPDVCPQCGKPYLKYFGVGTQQVEEQLLKAFPGVKALRMDLDTTRTKNAHYELLNAFERGSAQVLIGTQMIAKGLDIPNVTLVGVIAADSTLHIPDYRSGERTFQLLTQVAGRAGRADKPGHVVIQSYTPEHPVIDFASRHDYDGFYEYELASRRAALFPPFSLFIRLLFIGDDEDALYSISEEACQGLREAIADCLEKNGASPRELLFILSSPAPVKRKLGKYRYQVLIKLARTKNTAAVLQRIYEYHELHRRDEACGVEINPADMF